MSQILFWGEIGFLLEFKKGGLGVRFWKIIGQSNAKQIL